jgi:preprotein translocase subunit SecY
MINENHLRFLAVAYYVASYGTAMSLWFSEELHMIGFGWTIFLFNTYQIFTELHDNQINNEN